MGALSSGVILKLNAASSMFSQLSNSFVTLRFASTDLRSF
jgi:hypothetical protein